MDDHHNHGGDGHEMPTDGRALTGVAISATLHCLTGCAIGEVLGMAIGTAAGFSDLGTIALAVTLAFFFGYLLTSLPLLRAGFALAAVVPIALAADTLSIATMEIVDNAIMLVIPGAMEAGLGDIIFWGALSFALAVAFVITVPVNIWLIRRGKGHTAIHETGVHGGPPVKVVGAVTAVAFVFGVTVLAADGFNAEEGERHGEASPHEAAVVENEATAEGAETDAAFAAAMIPHHESAIVMAELARAQAQHPEVERLAEDIIETQSAEIEELEAIIDRVGSGDPSALGVPEEMSGMHVDIDALEQARPFDRAFIDEMVVHHEGAIQMAEAELVSGSDDEALALADEIIAAQSREIEQMNAWRAEWYGGASSEGTLPPDEAEHPSAAEH